MTDPGSEAPKPTVDLLGSIGTGLIVPWPSGVLYSNQTGGTSCNHPVLEGLYLPVENEFDPSSGRLNSPQPELASWFEGPKHLGTGATDGLDLEDADRIDRILARWSLACVVVDRARLAESEEAWVHVLILGEPLDGCFRGFEPYPRAAVLTWENSD